MDLKMPEMDGYDAAKILKQDISTKSIPIIAITASTRFNLKLEEMNQFFSDFLIKPIELFDLIECLKIYLKYNLTNKEPQVSEFEFSMELSDYQIQFLPEIIQKLESEFITEFNRVIQNQRINQIKEFGEKLVLLGKENFIQVLIKYGSEICVLADNFEVTSLLGILNEFPELLERLKAAYNSQHKNDGINN
jgi:CheY-like chemotaxis protein